MNAVAGSIVALTGAVLVVGGHVAHELHQAYGRTGYHTYQDTIILGYVVGAVGLALVADGVRSSLLRACRPMARGPSPQLPPQPDTGASILW